MVFLFHCFSCFLAIGICFFVFSLLYITYLFFFFFSSRRRHTRLTCDWSSDVCSSDLNLVGHSFTTMRDGLYPSLPNDPNGQPNIYRERTANSSDQFLWRIRAVWSLDQIGRASCRERV